jgi:hypothetical protein
MTGSEDWGLVMRMLKGGHQVRVSTMIIHHEGHVRYRDACRKKAQYAPGGAHYRANHGAQGVAVTSPRPWLRQPKALATPLGVGMLALKAGEVSAVLIAMATDRLGRHPTLPTRVDSSRMTDEPR